MNIRKKETHTNSPKSKKATILSLLLFSIILAVSLIGCSDMITVLGTVELNFDAQGGTHVEPKYLEKGTVLTDFPTPVLEGYTFAGWYRTKTFEGNPVTELKIVTDKNIPLFAKWTVNTGTRYKVEHYQQNINYSSRCLFLTTRPLVLWKFGGGFSCPSTCRCRLP
ncbi:MAG: InlB B-repeat-containing protein, partial [Sphaerochaeta sp.]|nr:InlB B-repeat-containing protein [Sphaerochaeta sp.]